MPAHIVAPCRRPSPWWLAGLLGLAACGSSDDALPAGAAPSGLAYSEVEVDLLVGVASASIQPLASAAGPDLEFSVAPPLPQGLQLDGTGAVRGTALQPAPPAVYQVRASNPFGYVDAELRLEVHAAFDALLDAYAVHATLGRLSHLRFDTADGRLLPAGSVPSAEAPLAVACDPLGRLVLVGGVGEPALGVHRLQNDGRPGALEPLAGLPAVTSLAMAPNGAFALAADLQTGWIGAYRIDAETGALVLNPQFAGAASPTDVAVHPDSRRFAIAAAGAASVRLLAIDPATAEPGPELTSFPVGSPHALAFAPDGGVLYVADLATSSVLALSIDAATGALGLKRTYPLSAEPRTLSVTRSGQALAIGLAAPAGALELELASGRAIGHVELPAAPRATLALGGQAADDLLHACPDAMALVRADAIEVRALHGSLPLPAALALRRGPHARGLESTGLFASLKGSSEVIGLEPTGAVGGYLPSGASFAAGHSPSGLLSDPRRGRTLALGELSGDLWQLGAPTGVPVGPLLRDLALTPDAEWLLIVGQGGLIALDADQPASGSIAPAGQSPSALVIAPAGDVVYTGARASDALHAFALDPDTGQLMELPWSPIQFEPDSEPRGLALDPSGRLLAVSLGDAARIELFSISPTPAERWPAPQPLATIATGAMPRALEFSPDGRYLVHAEVMADRLVAHDLSAPASPLECGSVPTPRGPFDIAFDPTGRVLTVAAQEVDALAWFELDPLGGALFERGELPLPVGASPTAVTHDLRWSLLD